jgi:tight adherence protein B
VSRFLRARRTSRRLRTLQPPASQPPYPLHRLAERRPRLVAGLVTVAVASVAGLLGGPVAAGAAAVYTVAAALILRSRRRDRLTTQARLDALDGLGGLAADLRAGVVPHTALFAALPSIRRDAGAMTRLTAAWEVAEEAGAPLADLLERVEADMRSRLAVKATLAAQAAGTRATAVLLVAFPVVGIAVGTGTGASPLRILLTTPIGAGCAAMAVLLQMAGLAWSARLVSSAGGVA